MQTRDLIAGEVSTRPFRVNPGPEERLVNVDVAESGDQVLVEEQALHLAASSKDHLAEAIGRERRREGFWAEATVQGPEQVAVDVEDPAELALVGESQLGAVVQPDRQVLEPDRGVRGHCDLERAGHAEVNEEGGPVVEVGDEVFAAPTETREGPPDHGRENGVPGRAEDAHERPDPGRDDATADHMVHQGAADGLDLG